MNDSRMGDPRRPEGPSPRPGRGEDPADLSSDEGRGPDVEAEAPDAGGGEGEARSPEEEVVERLRRELEGLNDRHLRLAAEYENYRRRSQGELADASTRAQAELVGDLVEVLDDFERVTSVDPEAVTVESLLEGVAMVERKLRRLLENGGLEELEPTGDPFDPNVMEAMARVDADTSEEDDTVDEVFQKGFRFRGHLVRPARVSVRKYE